MKVQEIIWPDDQIEHIALHGIDPNEVEPEILAYYQEILGDIPQFPTTCFSNLPNVIPIPFNSAEV